MTGAELTVEALARRVSAGLESGDVSQFADLLDPNVRWGAPDDPTPTCQNRSQVLSWYERGRSAGRSVHVVAVESRGDKILVELEVSRLHEPATVEERWQVMTCRHGRVTDVRAFERRDEALARLSD